MIKLIKQVACFNYFGYISHLQNIDIERKLGHFQQICGTIRRNFKNKTTKQTQNFRKTVTVPTLMHGLKHGLYQNFINGKLKG